MEAISLAGIALGVLAKDGIVIAAEKKVTSKLLEQTASAEKIYKLNEYVYLSPERERADGHDVNLLTIDS